MKLINADRLTELIEKIVPQSALELGYLYQIREYIKQMPTVDTQDLISRETLLKYAVYVELANGNKGWVIEKGYVEDLPTVELAEVTKNDD